MRSFDSCPVLPQIISKDLKDINEGKMFLNLGRHKFKKLGQISNKSNNYEERKYCEVWSIVHTTEFFSVK